MNKTHKHILIIAVSFFMTLATSAFADNQDKNSIQKVESYFKNLKTLQANFIQTDHNGGALTGTFYLNRPGKLRFEYNENEDFIVADGASIFYYDSYMKQRSHMPLKNSLAFFVLQPDIDLFHDVSIQDITQDDHFLNITLTLPDDPGAGSLTLGFVVFDNGRIHLKKWIVSDAQGLTTTVALNNLKTDVTFDKNLFFYSDPNRGKNTFN